MMDSPFQAGQLKENAMLISWSRSEDGFCHSKEGRFQISPIFRGRTKADSYVVRDRVKGKERSHLETQRECKDWAERQVKQDNGLIP